MEGLVPFLVVLVSGLFLSEVFKRLHLPYVTALILAGLIAGPEGLNIVESGELFDFFGATGVIFLMFIAGAEIQLGSLRKVPKGIWGFALFNASVPFLIGVAIGMYFEFSFIASLILGVTFMSSSVAVIIPSLESNDLMKTKIGKTIVSATVFEDIGSMIMLSLLLHQFSPRTEFPLWIYVPLVVIIVVLLKFSVPYLQKIYNYGKRGAELFEGELRFVLSILLVSVFVFESLGIHSIVAGFIIGMILSSSVRGKLEDKVRTVSYGIFIPFFFFSIGMQLDITGLFESENLLLTAVIVAGLVLGKFGSGYVAGKLFGYSSKEASLMGIATIPQLSTTLAAAFTAKELGLIPTEIVTSLIILSTLTTLVVPVDMRWLGARLEKTEPSN